VRRGAGLRPPGKHRPEYLDRHPGPYTGNLAPINQVDVGSELSGIVRSVGADFNDVVSVGQELARLDTSKLEAQALQARAALQGARARVLLARATVTEADANLARLKHVRELSGGQMPSEHDMDQADAALARARADQASAEAQVAQAGATLNATETDLKKTVIRSPINGIVLVRKVEPGQTVAASAPTCFRCFHSRTLQCTRFQSKAMTKDGETHRFQIGRAERKMPPGKGRRSVATPGRLPKGSSKDRIP